MGGWEGWPEPGTWDGVRVVPCSREGAWATDCTHSPSDGPCRQVPSLEWCHQSTLGPLLSCLLVRALGCCGGPHSIVRSVVGSLWSPPRSQCPKQKTAGCKSSTIINDVTEASRTLYRVYGPGRSRMAPGFLALGFKPWGLGRD